MLLAQVFRGFDDCHFFRIFRFRGQLVPFDIAKLITCWIVHEAQVVPREFKQHDNFQVNAAATLALYRIKTSNIKHQTSNLKLQT